MELSDIRETIKLQLTGDVLNNDIDDATYDKLINMSIQELNRYYNATELKEVTGASCVDLSQYPEIRTVMNVYATPNTRGSVTSNASADPWYTSQLQLFNIGQGYYNPNKVVNRMLAYNLVKQTANTISGTDFNFKQDKKGQKLYINYSQGVPTKITIEYIPLLTDVSDITSDHWLDMLQKLALAHCKIALGRIRTRFTQSGALWSGDGETILQEGKTELENLRESLRKNSDLLMPLD